MPKMKSHSGTKKRAKKTGSGKISLKRSCRNHLLLQKSKKRRRLNSTIIPQSAKVQKNLSRLIPYA